MTTFRTKEELENMRLLDKQLLEELKKPQYIDTYVAIKSFKVIAVANSEEDLMNKLQGKDYEMAFPVPDYKNGIILSLF